MSNTFSQASNFTSAMRGTVDLRTGQFRAMLQIENILANRMKGPSVPFGFRYAPFNEIDYGFGRGWSLIWSSYDSDNKLLLPSDGTVLKIAPKTTDGVQTIVQGPLEKVIFSRLGTQAYSVTHAEGNVDILKGSSYGYSVKVPERIFSKAGHSVRLTWDEPDVSHHRLTGFYDDDGRQILAVDYGNALAPVITLWPGSGESLVIRLGLTVRSGVSYLTSIACGTDYEWTLGYDYSLSSTLAPLNAISHAGGLIETAVYQKEGFQLPTDAHSTERIPYVVSHTLDPGCGQPPVVRKYSYDPSGRNYLGYNTTFLSYSADQDNLYYSNNLQYQYSSTEETLGPDGVNIVSKQTFDMVHLMVSDETVQAGHHTVANWSYVRKQGFSYSAQPANFQCPTGISTLYRIEGVDGTREDRESMVFDAAGRLTQWVRTDGTRTDIAYYPAAGQGFDCPPDPTGGKGIYPASVTTTPPATDFSAPVERREFTYCRLSVGGNRSDPARPVEYCLLRNRESFYVDGRLMSEVSRTYEDTNAASENYGRMSRQFSTKYGDDGTAYADVMDFRYETVAYPFGDALDCLCVTQQLTAHDGLVMVEKNYYSSPTGVLLASVDRLGVATVFTRDTYGRMLSMTRGAAPGGAAGDQSLTVRFAYEPYQYAPSDARRYNTEEVTAADGGRVRHISDGLARPWKEQVFVAGAWQDYREYSYDCLGRAKRMTISDRIEREAAVETSTLTEDYTYDSWGYLSGAARNDGSARSIAVDVLNFATSVVDFYATASIRTDFDPATRLPKTVGRYDASGNLLAAPLHFGYDGAGRLRRATDALGRTTDYDYDGWSRLSAVTCPDGTRITRAYTDGSSLALVKGIAVDGVELGTQQFDGLARIASASIGGRVTRYAYDRDGAIVPASVADPVTTVAYDYIDAFGAAVKRRYVPGGDIAISYDYDGGTGQMLAARQTGLDARGPDQSFTYDAMGRVNAIRYMAVGQTLGTVRYNRSMAGNLAEYTGIRGDTTSCYYNTDGAALSRVVDGNVTVIPRYEQGRFTGWHAGTMSAGATVNLSRDALDREQSRTIALTTNEGIAVERGYDDNDRVKSRTVFDYRSGSKGSRISNAAYSYDVNGRLTGFQAEGGNFGSSDDPAITGEAYGYDRFDNITAYRATGRNGVTRSFAYTGADPTQLSAVTSRVGGGAAMKSLLSYDAAGRLTMDDRGRSYSYDAFGRLARIADGGASIDCTYDAFDRLHGQYGSDGTSRNVYYDGGKEVRIVEQGGGCHRLVNLGRATAALVNGSDATFIGPDLGGSPILTLGPSATTSTDYTPFGCTPDMEQGNGAVRVGFNGDVPDPFAGLYHPGQGYRAYDPRMMRFSSPDSLSPFGPGGINAYGYCGGDPVNFIDPTGHVKWGAVAGYIGFGLTILAGIAYVAFPAVQIAKNSLKFTQIAVRIARIAGGLSLLASGVTGLAGVIVGQQEESGAIRDADGNVVDSTDNGKAETGRKLVLASLILGAIGALLVLASGIAEWRLNRPEDEDDGSMRSETALRNGQMQESAPSQPLLEEEWAAPSPRHMTQFSRSREGVENAVQWNEMNLSQDTNWQDDDDASSYAGDYTRQPARNRVHRYSPRRISKV